ncbi:MAG: hypothetical protein ACREXP_14830 [Steroidobacteraceae bacterium]
MEQAAAVFNGAIVLTAGFSDDGFFGSTRYNDVHSTTDGTTWSEQTLSAPFSPRSSPILLNHNNQLYLIGGSGISRTHEVWRSSNGSDWSTAFSHPISPP